MPRAIASWTQTLGDLKAAGATLYAVCSGYHPSTKANLDKMIAARGPTFSLWNRTFPCPRPGCAGRVFFNASMGNHWPIPMRFAYRQDVERVWGLDIESGVDRG